ncbi:MAG: aspartate--tRNA ligase [bacterium]
MLDSIRGLKRTHYCGTLGESDIGREVVLMGWVARRRDHGGLIFVDLRDRTGMVQVVFDPTLGANAHEKGHLLRPEFVIAIRGEVVRRPEGTENPSLPTGKVEVRSAELRILNESRTPPFPMEDGGDVSGDVRLRYRYLDLRRPSIQRALILRHRLAQAVRQYMTDAGFIEIETPMLTRSTPEGARDYIVPSRVNPGKFYALPQSPQLFKQLLMVSGFDRYFQIVRCFRDEDLRADRQPEFTQIDIEMSFVDEEDIFATVEGLVAHSLKEVLGLEVPIPFPRITYDSAMNRYGSDKPDVRFGMELLDISDIAAHCEFKVMRGAVERGGVVKGLRVPGGASFSRGEIDGCADFAKRFGAGGLAWIRISGGEAESPIVKFFSPGELREIIARMGAEDGDLLLFVADDWKIACESLGRLRLELGSRLDMIDDGEHRFIWVVDFPLLEYSPEEGRYVAMHHPFTSPKDEDLEFFGSDPGRIRSRAYDLVMDGIEIAGGSIRIHRRDLQDKMFEALGIGEDEAREKFGFLLEAFEYGAPPHGGIAFGFDRWVARLVGADTIRDVIAFPKTQSAICLMTNAPNRVSDGQLRELHIRVTGD